ncbi:xanthine dehydrogenase subunit D [Anoxybacillus geothermalis]|uniref:xanthine dehydrogenase subunit D n=1 Tax=Geobacillus TaxID=129337 RepID=UPI00078D13EA|nr:MULTISPECIES: xanthine dehydrogenase subunit D [Geobacillus]AMQ20909.1 xanthine dehydrogenase subunit D [Geobacillus sp. JS12]MED4924063.1 xanthine dehydrogenase subunit D [Anoxybacillus geothermalis]OQP13345.1 xanthine dehydrogenase subunit D [Geobacillus zalihae]
MKFTYSNNLQRSLIRPDGVDKVTGKLKFLTDLSFPNMLHGKILRSAYPHAKIISISTKKAEELPGVRAVITSKDVPGLNRFGLIFPDQPVLCDERVRYVGDAVAAVAAETEEIAEKALQLIEVEYEPLPVIDDPEQALLPSAPRLHPDGNILHQASYQKGNVEEAFQTCDVIVEETYELPRQMHAYMETEGGVIVPEKDGRITVYVGTQHGYKDRFQLARILNVPESKIRVVSSPIGGSFGGKDELNIQPYGALLAIKTGCPVKIHQSRRESVRSGLKRHPMKITMKTGASRNGKILAHQVRIIADTGAYATLGPAVLDFAVEHATGPYIIPNVHVEGLSVYTNNGVAGEFRGFGGNQVTFALEGQIDRLAVKLGICPMELRKRNLRKADDLGPVGQEIAPTDGAAQVLKAISQSPLLNKKESIEWGEGTDRWKKTGIGVAIAMHGGGLGYGRLDPAGGRLSLNEDGKIEIAFGFEEFGQGLLSVIEQLVIKEIGCSANDIKITIGDTDRVPRSGSSTASRGTSMVWHALQRMKDPFKKRLLEKASQCTGVPATQLYLGPIGIWSCDGLNSEPLITYQQIAHETKDDPIQIETEFHFPTTPHSIPGGHYLYSFAACAVKVEVDELTGIVRVKNLEQAVAAGPVIYPTGYLGQIEGGSVMALGYTLLEEAIMEKGKYVTENFDSYLIPTINDIPHSMDITAIEELYEGDPYGPRGVGEIGTVAVAPAIAKAIYDAIGLWVTKLPVSREEIVKAVNQREMREWLTTKL